LNKHCPTVQAKRRISTEGKKGLWVIGGSLADVV